MNPPFKGKPPRLREVFQAYDSPVYFVTFCTYERRSILACDAAHEAFRQYAERGAAEKRATVGRYVIMPDHVHVFVCGGREFDVGLWVRGLKRAMGSALQTTAAGTAATTTAATTTIWQPGFFDHLLRNSESYDQKWHYVRENPVRAKLVKQADDWPYQGEIVAIDRV
jgi:REP element-mobilizing transposase RayT